MRILVTGGAGFVGSHLCERLLADGHEVVALDNFVTGARRNVRTFEGSDRFTLVEANAIDGLPVEGRLDRIFHLAAQSYVTTSFLAPADTLDTNVIGTTNLLDAVRLAEIDPRIHICSSSEVYGQVAEDEVPIRESNPFRPASPYAVSKVGEDMIALQYFLTYGLKTIRTRMFTHTGPRRGDVFAESAFAKQIAEIEAGVRDNPMRVGNLDSVRTFADVRDAVRAYWLLLEKCTPGEVYNIGGSRTMTVGEMLDVLKGLVDCPVEHEVDPALLRRSDVTLQIPDTSKFRGESGWEPEIPLDTTLEDLLDYHRQRIASSGSGPK